MPLCKSASWWLQPQSQVVCTFGRSFFAPPTPPGIFSWEYWLYLLHPLCPAARPPASAQRLPAAPAFSSLLPALPPLPLPRSHPPSPPFSSPLFLSHPLSLSASPFSPFQPPLTGGFPPLPSSPHPLTPPLPTAAPPFSPPGVAPLRERGAGGDTGSAAGGFLPRPPPRCRAAVSR
ncbi:unnamed protein product, partial [Bubo scandiacus]